MTDEAATGSEDDDATRLPLVWNHDSAGPDDDGPRCVADIATAYVGWNVLTGQRALLVADAGWVHEVGGRNLADLMQAEAREPAVAALLTATTTLSSRALLDVDCAVRGAPYAGAGAVPAAICVTGAGDALLGQPRDGTVWNEPHVDVDVEWIDRAPTVERVLQRQLGGRALDRAHFRDAAVAVARTPRRGLGAVAEACWTHVRVSRDFDDRRCARLTPDTVEQLLRKLDRVDAYLDRPGTDATAPGLLAPDFPFEVRNESEATLNQYRMERTFRAGTEMAVFEQHFTLPDDKRCHVFADGSVVWVGYAGQHLGTATG